MNHWDPMGTSFADILKKFIDENERKPTVGELIALFNNASYKDLYLDPIDDIEIAMIQKYFVRRVSASDVEENTEKAQIAVDASAASKSYDAFAYYARFLTRKNIVIALQNTDPAFGEYTKLLGKTLLSISPTALTASGAAQVLGAKKPEDAIEGGLDFTFGSSALALQTITTGKPHYRSHQSAKENASYSFEELFADPAKFIKAAPQEPLLLTYTPTARTINQVHNLPQPIKQRQSFMTGREWYDYYTTKYGAEKVEWVSGSGVSLTWPSELPMPIGRLFRVSPGPRSSAFTRELTLSKGSRPPETIAHHVKFLQLNGDDSGLTNGAWVPTVPHSRGHGQLTPIINAQEYGTEFVIRPRN